jgi:hyperosmotically inducible periplasmic protein
MRHILVGGLLGAGLLFAQGNPNDDKLYDKVRMKLAENADVNGGGIEVIVHDGAVTLKGKVLHERQKAKAEKVAKKVKGVKSVSNQLTVELGGK